MNDTPSTLPAGMLPAGSSQPTTTVLPYSGEELRLAWRQPARALDLVLAERERLAASIMLGTHPWTLVLVLLACALLAALPYGFVQGLASWWKIAALFGGSVLLCWPSLQVISGYLGSTFRTAQSLALALVIASVAALFTFGFFPVVWFLGQTMETGDWIDARDASVVLLATALLAGLLQVTRCAAIDRSRLPGQSGFWVLLTWQVLVAFVTFRMARALGLLG